MNSFVDIVIFSDSEEWDAPLCAKSDKTLPISLISRATVARLQLGYTEPQRETVEDSEHKLYSPIGQLQLRWYKKGRARSHPETFYVVEMTACVILGATASSETTDANDSAIRTLGLDQQTTAEKERREQKKLEVQQRRAQEKKEQEEREAKKRQDEREARKQ